MDTFKTLRSGLSNLDLEKLMTRMKTVQEDIQNLEEELDKRYQLLKYIDSLILKKRSYSNN